MPRPANLTDAIQLVRKCGLLEDRAVKEFVSRTKRAGFHGLTPEGLFARMVDDALLTPFQARQLTEGRWRGLVLGNYHLKSRIGKGGMGQVFLGEHHEHRKPVAIKVLNANFAEDRIAKARLEREATATAGLDHPNIVKFVDLDAAHSPPYLVMEYVDGLSLQAIVAHTGTLSVEATALCGRQIANGLAHAADAGLVHRDIKPANLLLDRSGVIKILDLGIVLLRGDSARLTLNPDGRSTVLGTVDYLAPEQAQDSHRVDARADIYALGGTLYFLLAGHPPYAEGGSHLLNRDVAAPPPIHRLRPDVPEELSDAIARMLAPNPSARFQCARDVVEVLAQWARPVAGFPEDLFEQIPGPDGTGEFQALTKSTRLGHGEWNRNRMQMNGSSVHASLSVTLSTDLLPISTDTPMMRPAPESLGMASVVTPAPQSEQTRPIPALTATAEHRPIAKVRPQVATVACRRTPYKIALILGLVAVIAGVAIAWALGAFAGVVVRQGSLRSSDSTTESCAVGKVPLHPLGTSRVN